MKNSEIKEDSGRRRDSKGNGGQSSAGGRRSLDEGQSRRSGAQQATINPLLSEVSLRNSENV